MCIIHINQLANTCLTRAGPYARAHPQTLHPTLLDLSYFHRLASSIFLASTCSWRPINLKRIHWHSGIH